MQDESQKNEYANSLNLPKTDFPLRAHFAQADAAMLQRWSDEKLSEKTFNCHAGSEKFILHDGPPYANGHIHLGHAYNKIAKDIITKSERMSGKHVPVIPGWDCHGLPIELKVTQEQSGLSREELKKACRAYAQKWIDVQKEEFKKLGVMMHWDKPYTTMSSSYEAAIVRAFGVFYKQGFIQKKLKTVPWCASCQTVLANAEIEYAERKDPSIFCIFPMQQEHVQKLFPQVAGREVGLLIWTTTPWTLPLNRAVVLHPGASYSLVEMNGKLVILGSELVSKVAATAGTTATVIAKFVAEDLIGLKIHHPFVPNLLVPVIGDGFVSLEDGTACVHSAPGCGPEDYEVGIKNNLEIYSPLTVDGKYSPDIMPSELVGMPIADGQIWVIKKLAELDRIFFKSSLRHSYPHCWRCRNGLMFRATSQWFCDLSQHNLKDRALAAIEHLKMYPQTGRNRFSATLEGRLEWCLSRQRTWGVPIPALHCLNCAHVFTNSELIESAAAGIARDGIEFWDRVSVSQLGVNQCPSCHQTNLGKEFDILDVWFESGVSHWAVLVGNKDQAFPADMYLEGKDQHRAWFQSSLLTGLVLEEVAPMHEILTHGFTVDEQGKKMSKSLGNVVTPFQIIDQVGTDGLRLWVASNNYDSDPVVSAALLKNVSEVYRKVRNTCRFLLSNLYDFDMKRDGVYVERMYGVDQYALTRLNQFNADVQASYKNRDVTAVFHSLADYCSKDLSAFYLDIIKDRLYVEQPDSIARRSAQTVCYRILHVLTTTMAPILSFTAEQVFDHYKKQGQDSIHMQTFDVTEELYQKIMSLYNSDAQPYHLQNTMTSVQVALNYDDVWKKITEIRSAILKALEAVREQGLVRHSLDARVTLHIADVELLKQINALLLHFNKQDFAAFMKELCIVSQFEVETAPLTTMREVVPGVFVTVEKAMGEKCPRCWQWNIQAAEDGLCVRCQEVLNQ
ncbi:isoleucine--tRNA ligase [Candidatus Babeliales bacterium]|nr:isoleucine--tRNA ligase [Candidatus Babeliales bacterium]